MVQVLRHLKSNKLIHDRQYDFRRYSSICNSWNKAIYLGKETNFRLALDGKTEGEDLEVHLGGLRGFVGDIWFFQALTTRGITPVMRGPLL